MKCIARIITTVAVALALFSTAASAEEKAAKAEPLSTDAQKFSYAVGLQIGQSLVRQGVEIDADAFVLAIKDTAAGQEPRLSMEEMERVLKAQEDKANANLKAMADKNLKAGEAYRAEYKKKEGVKELPGGLQYRVLSDGKGKKPAADDMVEVNYSGKLIDGREFDASARHGGPATLTLDRVIKGWQQALTEMGEGAKWELVIPPELAYGLKGAGGVIGPNETLVFEIELLAVKGKAAAEGTN